MKIYYQSDHCRKHCSPRIVQHRFNRGIFFSNDTLFFIGKRMRDTIVIEKKIFIAEEVVKISKNMFQTQKKLSKIWFKMYQLLSESAI